MPIGSGGIRQRSGMAPDDGFRGSRTRKFRSKNFPRSGKDLERIRENALRLKSAEAELKAAFESGLKGLGVKDFKNRDFLVKALIREGLVKSVSSFGTVRNLLVKMEREEIIRPIRELKIAAIRALRIAKQREKLLSRSKSQRKK